MPKLPLAERQERQPAEALLLGAKQFMRASQILLRHEPRAEKGDYFESGYIMYPYFFLVGQSVELSLKSVLLRAGKDHDFIQYTVGHDLEKSSDIVRKIEPKFGLFFDLYANEIKTINKLYHGKELQYRLTGDVVVPALGNADKWCSNAYGLARDFLAGKPLRFSR